MWAESGEVIMPTLASRSHGIFTNSQGLDTRLKNKVTIISPGDLKFRHTFSALLKRRKFTHTASSIQLFKKSSQMEKGGMSATNKDQRRQLSSSIMLL